jgi:transcriptional regulator with XRE-family HTH domain
MSAATSHTVSQREKQIPSKLDLSFLRSIIRQRQMSISALAFKTGVPKATMRRFVNGSVQKPTFQMVQDVSKCLNMDIGYFLEANKEITSLNSSRNKSLVAIKVPIVEWNEIKQWMDRKMDRMLLLEKQWIHTNRALGPKAFALKSTVVMEPYIPKGSVMIINPQGKLEDEKLVLVATGEMTQPTIYKAINYESGFYLKPLLKEGNIKRLIRLTSEVSVIGTLEEAVTFL